MELLSSDAPGTNEPLVLAAFESAPLDRIYAALDGGADPSAAEENGYSALMFAVRNGRADIAELLIARRLVPLAPTKAKRALYVLPYVALCGEKARTMKSMLSGTTLKAGELTGLSEPARKNGGGLHGGRLV